MSEKKRTLGSDLQKIDAHVITPEEYEEIPELTEEWFQERQTSMRAPSSSEGDVRRPTTPRSSSACGSRPRCSTTSRPPGGLADADQRGPPEEHAGEACRRKVGASILGAPETPPA